MERRTFISLLGGTALWPYAARAQQTGRAVKIGILTSGNQLTSPVIERLRRELRELGYVEGRDITIEFRSSALEPARLPELASELVRMPVDVLITDSNVSVVAGKQATSVIPIVAVMGGEPMAAGLIASYSRPGGNVTGFTLLAPELGTKRLEILKETLPGARRIGVLWNSINVLNAAEQMSTIVQAAHRLGLEIVTTTLQHRDEIASAFDRLKAENVSAVMTLADAMMFSERQQVVDAALKARLPGIFPERPFAQAGGLLSYGPDVLDVFKRAAGYVDRIIKGAKAGDLPFEQPARFEFAINLKTASALGIAVPPTLLARADEVIE
jgi:putative tryptophan/tyrosine transport system substrate-binding protein